MNGGIYHIDGGIYQGIYLGIYQGIYNLDILLIPWYIPWYIAKVVYTTFGVVYTMTQPSRCPLLFLWTLSFPFPSLPLSLPLQAPSFPPSSLGEQISVPGRQLFQSSSSLVVSVSVPPFLPPRRGLPLPRPWALLPSSSNGCPLQPQKGHRRITQHSAMTISTAASGPGRARGPSCDAPSLDSSPLPRDGRLGLEGCGPPLEIPWKHGPLSSESAYSHFDFSGHFRAELRFLVGTDSGLKFETNRP